MSLADLSEHTFWRPPSLDALCAKLTARRAAGEETVLLAGGTDWVVEEEVRKAAPVGARRPLIADVSRLPDLRGIRVDADGSLVIGAAATYLEMRRDPLVLAHAPLLAEVAKDIGAIQIQARGTLGGNVATASPAGDGVAAIAAYGAAVVVRSTRGERSIPFAQLQTGYKKSTRAPDEVIVALRIAPAADGAARPGAPTVRKVFWRKVGTRRAQSISKVALAAVLDISGGILVRAGFGMASVAPVTALLPTVRAALENKPLTYAPRDLDAALDEDISPIDDVRSTAAYRRHVAHVLLHTALREAGLSPAPSSSSV